MWQEPVPLSIICSSLLLPVCFSTEASKEETPKLIGDVHWLGHGRRPLVRQQDLPASHLPHVSQTPRNTWKLPQPLTAGLLRPAQRERCGPDGDQQEETVHVSLQIRKRHVSGYIHWVYQEWKSCGRVETGDQWLLNRCEQISSPFHLSSIITYKKAYSFVTKGKTGGETHYLITYIILSFSRHRQDTHNTCTRRKTRLLFALLLKRNSDQLSQITYL